MTATEWPARVWGRIALVTGVLAAAALFAESSFAFVQALAPINVLTARATSQIIGWIGMAAHRELAILTHPSGFGYEIVLSCTGVIPAGLLAAAILSAAAPLAARLSGAALGTLGVLILNQIRLVSLFYIGVQHPEAFGFAHSPIWQGMTIAFLIGFFYEWKHCAVSSSA